MVEDNRCEDEDADQAGRKRLCVPPEPRSLATLTALPLLVACVVSTPLPVYLVVRSGGASAAVSAAPPLCAVGSDPTPRLVIDSSSPALVDSLLRSADWDTAGRQRIEAARLAADRLA